MADYAAYTAGKNMYKAETVTVSTTGIGATTANVDNHAKTLGSWNKAAAAIIQSTANNVFYTLDGSTPSASNGKRLTAGDILGLAGYSKIKKLLMVREGASDATVHIEYYN